MLNAVRFAMGQCVDQRLGLGFDPMGIATMDTNRTLERDKLILLETVLQSRSLTQLSNDIKLPIVLIDLMTEERGQIDTKIN